MGWEIKDNKPLESLLMSIVQSGLSILGCKVYPLLSSCTWMERVRTSAGVFKISQLAVVSCIELSVRTMTLSVSLEMS